MSNENDSQNDNIDWEQVLLSLHSYTRSLANSKRWFRGNGTSNFLKGKEIEDYVNEAIVRYLQHPEKFDSKKGSLINYLQYNLIRNLVGNDSRTLENKSSDNSFSIAHEKEEDMEDSGNYLDSILPYVESYFDEELDYNNIMDSIEMEIGNDELLKNLFNSVTQQNMKRREVIELYKLTSKEYDNGIRRLKTILNKVANQYDLSKQSL